MRTRRSELPRFGSTDVRHNNLYKCLIFKLSTGVERASSAFPHPSTYCKPTGFEGIALSAYLLVALPLKLQGADGAPAGVVLVGGLEQG